jgi:hypothetical protein
LFAFAVLTNITTVLNNAYSWGSTFYDSAIFQTVIWRSGLSLKLPASFGGMSFLHTHISPINYLPNALSYLMPIDRMTYYGLTYGIIDGLLLLAVFNILHQLFGARVIPAAAGTILFYFSGQITVAQFEPHQETASALFTLGFFISWARDRWRCAVAMLLLNATVREDCGALLAFPLFLLALHSWWSERRTGVTRDTIRLFALALISTVLSVATIAFKREYFHLFDVMSAVYYPPWPNSFAHLSGPLIMARVKSVILIAQYIWLPGVLLCVGAALLRDLRLTFAFVAYLPFWIFNFFSILDMNATLDSYKSFPFVLMLVWPAILAVRASAHRRRALALLQVAVLLAASFGWRDGAVHFAAPTGVEQLKRRWLLQPETEHADIYRMLEPRLAIGNLGSMRVSMGVLALYPYSFERYDYSAIRDGAEYGAPYLTSLIWFAGDRDQSRTDTFLELGHFPYRYRIAGTKLWIASRKPPEQLPAFAGLIETTEHP